MTPQYFVETLKQVVQEATIDDMISNLQKPPGRNPSQSLLQQSSFYNNLTEAQKVDLKKILAETAEMALFGLFCVLDGVRAIEDGEEKGNLELWYRNGETTLLLNDPNNEFLHDLI